MATVSKVGLRTRILKNLLTKRKDRWINIFFKYFTKKRFRQSLKKLLQNYTRRKITPDKIAPSFDGLDNLHCLLFLL